MMNEVVTPGQLLYEADRTPVWARARPRWAGPFLFQGAHEETR